MSHERLRLVAEVSDQFTGPLRKLETSLRSVAETGAQVGKDLKGRFDGLHGSVGKATSALQGMTPVLSALGVGGMTAGLSLAGMAGVLKGFAGGTQQLAILSKETGVTIDQLRAFGALGERFGVTTETMQNGVMRFSESMSRMRKRYGEEYVTLQAMGLGELVEKLVAAPNVKASLDMAMDALGQIGDPVKRRKAAEQLFGGSEIGAVAGQLPGKVSEVLAEIERRQGKTTDAQINAAQKFQQTFSELRENIDGLRVQALGPLLTSFNEFVKTLTTPQAQSWFNQQIIELKTIVHDSIDELKRLDSWGESLKSVGGDLKTNTIQEVETITKAYNALKSLFGIGNPAVQKQSFGGGGIGGAGGAVIQNASFGGGSASFQNANFGGGMGGGGGPGFGAFGGPMPTLGGGYGLGGTASGGGPAGSGGTSSAGRLPTGGDPEIAAYIRHRAGKLGIDPETAVRVARTEALNVFDPNKPDGGGDQGTSFGPFQLHYGGSGIRGLNSPGLGDDFTKQTGLNARDPKTWRSQVDFALEYARKHGWGSWHGARNNGIPNMAGIGTYNGPIPPMPETATGNRGGPVGLDGQVGIDLGNGTMRMPNGRIRSIIPGQTAPASSYEASRSRPGDQMMQRFYGDQAPSMKRKAATGSIDITLGGFGANAKPRANVDDLLREVPTSKGSQLGSVSL